MNDDYFEEQFKNLFEDDEENDDEHAGHEVVKSFCYGEWFWYCRDCKIEVIK